MNLLKSLDAALVVSTKASTTGLATRAGGSSPFQFQYLNGQAVLYDSRTRTYIEQGYLTNSDLYSVINYIMRKARRAKFVLYAVKDGKALDDYRLLKGEGATPDSLKQARVIRHKALEEASQPSIDKLLTNPNPEQNFGQFVDAAYAYALLTGERFMQTIGGLYPVSSLYILPSTLMEVKSGESYQSIGGYVYMPTQGQLSSDEVIYSRNFMPALNGHADDLRGLSPLRVLALSMQKSNEGRLSALRQYQNAGPPGVLSFVPYRESDEALNEAQAQQVEAKLARRGGSEGRGRVHVSPMKADWTQLGLSPVDLDILQSGLFDLRDFCRVYGIDSKVLGDPSSSTYNNMAEARKAAITDAVIPLVQGLGDDLNAAIQPFNVKGKTYFIDADVTHFPELAEDMNAMADRLLKLPLTQNEIREAMQYERDANPLMDQVWLDSNRTPLSEWGATIQPASNADQTY